MRRLLELGYGLYALLAILCVALALVLPVLFLPTLSLRRDTGRLAVRLGMALAFIRVRIQGLEHLPAGPCVVVSNHASYLDGPLMTAALPSRFTFMVQHGAARWPIAGWIIQRMGVTFVNRGSARSGAAQTRGLIRRLGEGQSLVVFPEGTFAAPAGLLPFRNGAFLMAAHAGVPVVPGVIRGTRRIFGEGARLLRPGAVDIELFAPLAPAGDHRQAIQQLSDRTRSVVLRHCGEPDRGNPVKARG
ncbi:MAG TPA: lysophospholipid acyltransferase family protein [Verrucomicrobiae bacterium]|nr:lysophospholipid acyltransferase family protein [Verrucomicrobiae bacterium]